jgi:short-subunit dehydrogenase
VQKEGPFLVLPADGDRAHGSLVPRRYPASVKNLQDRTAAVTGAASGIGRAVALELARRGCHLALADLDAARLEEVGEAVRALGRQAHLTRLDVADPAAVEAWAGAVEADAGGASILVNNAGVSVYGTFASQSPADVDWLLGVNLGGVLHGCRAFGPQLRARRGHIVNMASMAAMVGMPMQSTYSASKAAVRAFSVGLRAELSAVGVGVTVVLPGTVGTRLMAGARSEHPEVTGFMERGMNRVGVAPERVARAVVRGIRRNRAEVRVGPDAHLLHMAMALAPWLPRWALGLLFRRMADESGEPHRGGAAR